MFLKKYKNKRETKQKSITKKICLKYKKYTNIKKQNTWQTDS